MKVENSAHEAIARSEADAISSAREAIARLTNEILMIHDPLRAIDVAMVLTMVVVAYEHAYEKHPNFPSDHHGYAVVLEELDEAWDDLKAGNARGMKEEFIQVAASAVRFLIDRCV